MDKQYHDFRWFSLLILLFVAVAVFFSQSALAEKQEEATNVAGFTYNANFPDNQLEEDIGYYKLKMEPSQKQTLTIALSNPGTKKVTVLVSFNGAKTNQNGVIEYGDSTIKNDPSLAFAFEDIVKGPETVELNGGETKNLDVTIQMPETNVEGVIAGGIQLMKAEQDAPETDAGGSKIVNQYAYVIGVLLQENEAEIAPELNLNKVYAEQYNHRNTIFVDFSNVEPGFLNDMTVETQITAKDSENVLYERKQAAMRMAPNSFIQFPISMNGDKMASGTYVATVLVTAGDQRWAWTEEFEITEKEATKFNERDVGLVQEKGLNWGVIIAIVSGVVGLIAVIFGGLTLRRKSKEKKAAVERAARKRKKQEKEAKAGRK